MESEQTKRNGQQYVEGISSDLFVESPHFGTRRAALAMDLLSFCTGCGAVVYRRDLLDAFHARLDAMDREHGESRLEDALDKTTRPKPEGESDVDRLVKNLKRGWSHLLIPHDQSASQFAHDATVEAFWRAIAFALAQQASERPTELQVAIAVSKWAGAAKGTDAAAAMDEIYRLVGARP